MPDKAPAFQWYPKDCDTDENVKAMDDREFGFFVRLLNHAWLNNGVPSDLKRLAMVMGRTNGYVAKIWPAMADCFEERDGRFFNKKQEFFRKNSQLFSEKKSAAATARWDKSNKTKDRHDASASFVHTPVQCPPTASSTAFKTNTLTPRAVDYVPRAVDEYPEFGRAVREKFPEASRTVLMQISIAVGQRLAGANGPLRGELTDAIMAEAVRHCAKAWPTQNSPHGYTKTVPQCVYTWLTQGKPQEPDQPEYYNLRKEREQEAERRKKIEQEGFIPFRSTN